MTLSLILCCQLAVVKEKVLSGAGEDLKQLLSDLEQLINLSEGTLDCTTLSHLSSCYDLVTVTQRT